MQRIGKWLLGLLLAVLAVDLLVQLLRPVKLMGFFTNDDENLFPASALEKEYHEEVGGRIVFDDSIYILPGSGDPLVTASSSKMVASIAAKELDFIVSPREVYEHYAPALKMADIKSLVPTLRDDQFLSKTDAKGKTIKAALDLAESRLLKDKHPSRSYYLYIPANSIRRKATADFIRWLFDQK